jgi:N-acetylmuramoyl-L-alanine amidase
MDITKLSNIEIIGLTIIGEARGEPIEGQVAVGSVIRNRYLSNAKKYKHYTDVCLEPMQFSCWNKNDQNRPCLEELANKIFLNLDHRFDPYLQQCMYVAQGIQEMVLLDNTQGCRFYMEKKLFNDKRPSWATNAKNVKIINNHVFFKL